MVTEITPVYLENKHWPVAKNSEEEERCGENYGDVECPFCDSVICPERKLLRLGDKCWSCHAEIVRFEELAHSRNKGNGDER
jgi:hypothetical protein